MDVVVVPSLIIHTTPFYHLEEVVEQVAVVDEGFDFGFDCFFVLVAMKLTPRVALEVQKSV